MSELFDRHRALLDGALAALEARGFWTPFPEVPSGKIYGETARDDGLAAYEARLGTAFRPARPPRIAPGRGRGLALGAGARESPIRRRTRIHWSRPPRRRRRPGPTASPEARVGVCLEALVRLNAMSFEMGNAVMHTTGQAFAMAFQAGGPHAQDRGLEAVADGLGRDDAAAPPSAVWEKPQGKAAPIVLEKHWRLVPRGVALVIGCQTFPTWNSYPGLFASLATGNTGDREAASGRDPAAGADRRRAARRAGRGRACRATSCCSPPIRPRRR